MKPEIEEAFIERLKSGKNEQCHGTMCRAVESKTGGIDYSFCALGVLVQLHSESTDAAASQFGSVCFEEDDFTWDDYEALDLLYLGETGGLPMQVREWAGLSRFEAENGLRINDVPIYEYNDNGMQLDEIGQLIESRGFDNRIHLAKGIER